MREPTQETLLQGQDDPCYEYWRVGTALSKDKLANLLYWVILHRGAITQTSYIGDLKKFSRRQNAYNGATVMIRLKTGLKEQFEKDSGFELREPQKAQVN